MLQWRRLHVAAGSHNCIGPQDCRMNEVGAEFEFMS